MASRPAYESRDLVSQTNAQRTALEIKHDLLRDAERSEFGRRCRPVETQQMVDRSSVVLFDDAQFKNFQQRHHVGQIHLGRAVAQRPTQLFGRELTADRTFGQRLVREQRSEEFRAQPARVYYNVLLRGRHYSSHLYTSSIAGAVKRPPGLNGSFRTNESEMMRR